MKKGFLGLEKWAQALWLAPIGFLASFYAILKKKSPNSDIRAQSYGLSKFKAYIQIFLPQIFFFVANFFYSLVVNGNFSTKSLTLCVLYSVQYSLFTKAEYRLC